MEQTKFLTVIAVLDDETQERMNALQQKILSTGLVGTQTMQIPFHISLGSYPPDCGDEVLRSVRETAGKQTSFPIKLIGIHSFSERVLFLQPEENERLTALHSVFDCAYPQGFPWVPHATLFCGEEAEVRAAKKMIEDTVFPIDARVTAIELGRFFPAEKIERAYLLPGTSGKEEAAE